MRRLILCLAGILVPLAALADDVFLKGGGRLSGRIVKRNATTSGGGRRSRHDPGSRPRACCASRRDARPWTNTTSGPAASPLETWTAGSPWSGGRRPRAWAREKARAAYNRALSASPGDPRANAALGNVQQGDRWVSEEEELHGARLRAVRGGVDHAGRARAILRERDVAEAQDRTRQESETRVREAEARADEAEARARQAESDAEETQEGLPLWYGWGAGPTAWPADRSSRARHRRGCRSDDRKRTDPCSLRPCFSLRRPSGRSSSSCRLPRAAAGRNRVRYVAARGGRRRWRRPAPCG